MDERTKGIAILNDRLRKAMPSAKINIEISDKVATADLRASVIRAVQDYQDFDPEIDASGDHSVGVVVIADNAYVFRFTYEDERYDYATEIGKRKLSIMHSSEFRSLKLGKKVQVAAQKMLEQDAG